MVLLRSKVVFRNGKLDQSTVEFQNDGGVDMVQLKVDQSKVELQSNVEFQNGGGVDEFQLRVDQSKVELQS